MQDGLEFLKTLDAKDIYTKTHISYASIDAILNKSFEKLERINLTGFISILQREYEIDLSDFRIEFEAYLEEHANDKPVRTQIGENFKPQRSNKKWWWVLLLIITIAGALFYATTIDITINKDGTVHEINDSQIDEAKEKLLENKPLQPYLQKNEINVSTVTKVEKSSSLAKEIDIIDTDVVKTIELDAVEISTTVEATTLQLQNEVIVIVPKKKIWIGMIELPGMKKKDHIATQNITIDNTKDWLIVFGHGHVSIEKDNEILEFSKDRKMYFIYESGRLKQIDTDEFKMRNRGMIW